MKEVIDSTSKDIDEQIAAKGQISRDIVDEKDVTSDLRKEVEDRLQSLKQLNPTMYYEFEEKFQ